MKPVRLPAAATLALPRWALLALGMLYILPGLIGREPWKNDDAASFGIMWTMAHGSLHDWLWPNVAGLPIAEEGPLAFWLGALSIKLFGWLMGDVMGARVATIGVFLLGTVSVWFTSFNLGRRPDAQPLRLAFGGQPEPDDFGRTLADAAVLIYLGCLGLLMHSHTNTAEPLQVSLLAYLLYRAVRYVERPSLRNTALVGLALGGLTLTRGWLTPVALVLALLFCTQFLRMPLLRTVRELLLALLIGAAVSAGPGPGRRAGVRVGVGHAGRRHHAGPGLPVRGRQFLEPVQVARHRRQQTPAAAGRAVGEAVAHGRVQQLLQRLGVGEALRFEQAAVLVPQRGQQRAVDRPVAKARQLLAGVGLQFEDQHE